MNAAISPVAIAEAVVLLNAAFARKGYDGMDEEQIEALSDGDQCFDMLDDMEARIGIDVASARQVMTIAHCEAEGSIND